MSLAARSKEKRLYSQTTVSAKLVLISHFFRSDFSFPVISPPPPRPHTPWDVSLCRAYMSQFTVYPEKPKQLQLNHLDITLKKKTFLSSIISDISLIHVTYFSSMVIVLVKFNLYLFLVL